MSIFQFLLRNQVVFAGNTNHPACWLFSCLHSHPARETKWVHSNCGSTTVYMIQVIHRFFCLLCGITSTTVPAFSLRKGQWNFDLEDVENICSSRPVVLSTEPLQRHNVHEFWFWWKPHRLSAVSVIEGQVVALLSEWACSYSPDFQDSQITNKLDVQ